MSTEMTRIHEAVIGQTVIHRIDQSKGGAMTSQTQNEERWAAFARKKRPEYEKAIVRYGRRTLTGKIYEEKLAELDRLTDTALIYFGENAPNGDSLSPQELDILRTAFEIAFEGDPDNWKDFFDSEVVDKLGRKLQEVYAGSLPPGQTPALNVL